MKWKKFFDADVFEKLRKNRWEEEANDSGQWALAIFLIGWFLVCWKCCTFALIVKYIVEIKVWLHKKKISFIHKMYLYNRALKLYLHTVMGTIVFTK